MSDLQRSESTQLSHSSAQLLRSCEQRYVHYKVEKTQHDTDHNPDMQAFAVGKTFHQVLEDHNHVKPEKIVNVITEACKMHNCDEENIPMLHAMLLKYYRGHKAVGLEVVKCEYEINDEKVIGYVDVIMKEADGSWWIVDLKTYKSMYFVKPANLTKDYQLNLYAAYVEEIAEDLKLDPKKFKGCRLRVVTKPQLKQRKNEDYSSYVMRMTENAKFYDIALPKLESDIYHEHLDLHTRSMELRGGATPTRNYNNCFNYNSPCPWYSNCHGGSTFTDLTEEIEKYNEVNGFTL